MCREPASSVYIRGWQLESVCGRVGVTLKGSRKSFRGTPLISYLSSPVNNLTPLRLGFLLAGLKSPSLSVGHVMGNPRGWMVLSSYKLLVPGAKVGGCPGEAALREC